MTPAKAFLADQGSQDYGNSLRDLLWDLLVQTVTLRAPDVAEFLEAPHTIVTLSKGQTRDFLQAANIWFQLKKIADENTAVRDRRKIETMQGPECVDGSFAQVMAKIAQDSP